MGLLYGRTGCFNTKNNGFRPGQFVSDCSSNSIRVIKVTKQASERPISYRQATAMVVAKDGVRGLFLRGLGTRVLANGMQGMLFTIAWKGLEKEWGKQGAAATAATAG